MVEIIKVCLASTYKSKVVKGVGSRGELNAGREKTAK